MQLLVSALLDRWAGKPILVIGGGPSASKDLPRLHDDGVTPACVISANEHGFHQELFPVDLVVSLDRFHCFQKVPMESLLVPLARKHGAKLVNRCSWADYRIPDWNLVGNSGLAAVAVAAALGGSPVIVTGIDMFQGGHVYFHGPKLPPAERRKNRVSITKRNREALRPLKEFCAGAHIRPMSGPLRDVFQAYDPNETMKVAAGVDYRRRLQAIKPVYVECVRGFAIASHDMVDVGEKLAFSPREARDAKIVTHSRVLTDGRDLV